METKATYKAIAELPESTVVASYMPTAVHEGAYQSEAQLEAAFIAQLTAQGYEYLTIHTEAELVANLRTRLEELNGITLTASEWERLFTQTIAGTNEGIVEKTRRIQEDHIVAFTRDDGTLVNIRLLDKANIHANRLQVINQYEEEGGRHASRYDVTVLVNGLPLVHIELKRRGVPLKEAFNQINRYQRESFWAGSGLYEYVQLFVISNGTHTKYYSNTTRFSHVRALSGRGGLQKTSHSFEFTSYWADASSQVIADLMDFARTFFARHTLLNILTRYSVFTAEQLLLVMRPYQIVATERILERITVAHNYRRYGSVEAGGYIWHTTGSGKTLTSFKTAQLVTRLGFIAKVLFVVDRKDLDYQTIREYDRFERGAVSGNSSTRILQAQLENPSARIIVTTIQKLSTFIAKNPRHAIYGEQVVLIFDECHRSQFGRMHTAITRHFKKYYLFGFTGTPIFAKNASSTGAANLKTTAQAFGECLHTYTIVNAINDGNVLPFRIDYINTVKSRAGRPDIDVTGIDTEEALLAPARITAVTRYILEHFDQKTCRNATYQLKDKRVNGFNSILAVSSIAAARAYYGELQKQIADSGAGLTIATIFSFAPNEEEESGVLAEESFDTAALDGSSRDFLDRAVADYNALFQTNFDTSSQGFNDYYKDLSRRVKEREVDILIVVNMFLTGFDATTLNTLWVDKNLKMHGLIQAFSRTNRILNSVKRFGNIVCFRDLSAATDEAIARFGDAQAQGIVLLKIFTEYYEGYEEDGRHIAGYAEKIAELESRFPLGQAIEGEQAKKDFVVLFSSILRLQNILRAFDDYKGKAILTPLAMQNYTSIYHDIHDELKSPKGEKVSILDDVVFELELVRQVEVNIDYILLLVEKYHESNCEDKTILGAIDKAVRASLNLRSKRELIEQFIATINAGSSVREDWQEFVERERERELVEIIKSERLKEAGTRELVAAALRDGELRTSGTSIDSIMPPISRFGGGGGASREAKKQGIIARLMEFFKKFSGI